MNKISRAGLIGVSIGLAVNLIGWFAFHRASAEFFSHAWWSAWSATYFVWLTFLMVGFCKRGRV